MLTLWVIKKYTIATTFLLVWTTTQDKVAVQSFTMPIVTFSTILAMVDCCSCDWLYLFLSWFGHNQSL